MANASVVSLASALHLLLERLPELEVAGEQKKARSLRTQFLRNQFLLGLGAGSWRLTGWA